MIRVYRCSCSITKHIAFSLFFVSPPLNVLNYGAAGDYDVVIPGYVPTANYSIRVGLFYDDSVYNCSETFEVFNVLY